MIAVYGVKSEYWLSIRSVVLQQHAYMSLLHVCCGALLTMRPHQQ